MVCRAITKPFRKVWAAIPFTDPPLTGLTHVCGWSDIWRSRKAARTVGRSSVAIIEYIKQFDIPVIFVTAKTSVPDRVKGLKLGAEDYISKPFDLEELLARVATVLRRFHKTDNILEVGKIKIDTLERTVLLDGELVVLPAKEYDLLLYLVRNKNIALYRETIFEQVWQEPYLGNTRTIDLHIQRLKKKLNLGDAIETIYKVGYKFRAEKLK